MAAAVFVYNLPVQGAYLPDGVPFATGVLIAVGLCAPYVVHRDHPRGSFLGVVAAALVQLSLNVGPLPADVMLVLSVFGVAAHCGRRTSLAATVVAIVITCVATTRWGIGTTGSTVIGMVTVGAIMVAAWTWGSVIGRRRVYVDGLESRAAELEWDRDEQARIATQVERARIAREIHDIVSHSLSVVVVLADGASHAVRTDPAAAERALRDLGKTGRDALADMRRMLGVLRDDEPGSDVPQPNLARLSELVDSVSLPGVAVHLATAGAVRTLPAGTELAAYRIVQEALTNVRKHAGPAVTRVDVVLRFDDELEIRVTDDGGRVAAASEVDENTSAASISGAATGTGHGLLGMRERVRVHGGTMRAGTRDVGGFEVVVSLPIGDER
ncbi:two-component sensor histidine kinase [Williamsia phyllosphaerae]|uniref:histidine kinase n=1 Tax=Williamsia phyllosphaerae TaxID=885042 RepID=A0ABQ1UBJ4_9NOCA|nr:two-component sensor histidine kinase [Williamsia phyllosphaerae]